MQYRKNKKIKTLNKKRFSSEVMLHHHHERFDDGLSTSPRSESPTLIPNIYAESDNSSTFSDNSLLLHCDSDSNNDSNCASDCDEDSRAASEHEQADVNICDEPQDFNEIELLRQWALEGNLTFPHTRINKLLVILRVRLLRDLPKSAKTFLKTEEVNYSVRKFDATGDSEFVYFGATEYFQKTVNPSLHSDGIIELVINVDELQVFKSSSRQFWPILFKMFTEIDVYKRFPIAIYSRKHKTNNL